MKRLLTILSIFSICQAFGQSEPFVRRTYDTAFEVKSAVDGTIISSIKWPVKITMNATYLQDVARDSTLARPALIFFQGDGEVSSNPYNPTTDSLLNNRYGPEFWALNGWDYSVHLENGVHFPIVVTVSQAALNIHPEWGRTLLRELKALLHPRGGYFLCAGLSAGSYQIGNQLIFTAGVVGSTEGMSLIKCWVDLEGVGPEVFNPSTDWAINAGLANWATNFGGKFFGLEGTADSRNIGSLVTPLNNAVPNSAYYSFENFSCTGVGAGGHGCWQLMYSPFTLNWQCVSPITNTGLVANASNTMGNYKVDPNVGSSIFQWMLRQGDTTLVGGCNPIVNAGTNQTFFLPQNTTSTVGSVNYQCGHTASSTSWTQVSGPNTATISSASTLSPSFSGLIAGVYVFQLHVVDNTGGVGNGNVTITVQAEVPPTVSAGGPYIVALPATSVNLVGSSSGNGGATIVSNVWTKISGPGTQTITNNTTLTPTVLNLQAGNYVFQLQSTDNNGNSNTSTAAVTVGASQGNPLKYQVGLGEYQNFFIGPDSLLYGISTVSANIGIGGANATGIPQRVITTPANLKFIYVTGTLHAGCAVDVNGMVWTWGDGDQGQAGDGTLHPTPVLTPIKILTDSLGNPFNNVVSVISGYSANANPMTYAIKADGTLWAWGPLMCGMRGDSTFGDTARRPVQLLLPGGRLVQQVQAGAMLMVLTTDGHVFTTGGNGGAGPGSANFADLGYVGSGLQWLKFHDVGLSSIISIAGGMKWNYALRSDGKLFSWGSYGTMQGIAGSGTGTPVTTPRECVEIEAKLPAPIRVLVTNSETVHAILTNGTLWGWGENGEGGVGNGDELDFSNQAVLTPSGSTLWFYNVGFIGSSKMVILPVNIAPERSNFQMIWGGSHFNFPTIAEDSLGQLFSWGRNKVSILGNGIRDPIGGFFSRNFPNIWDVPKITKVNPFALTGTFITTVKGCVLGTLPDSICSNYTIPANTKPRPALGLISSGNKIFIDASGSSDDVHITYYNVTQTGGPALPYNILADIKDTISVTANGTYTFKLVTIDNGWLSDSVSTSVVVNQTGSAPIVAAVNPPTITSPVTTDTLTGAANGSGATITSTTWSWVSGPITPTIVSPGSLKTAVTGLVPGTYMFRLTATDSNGNTASATVTMLVNCSCYQFTLPTKTQ